MSKRRRSSWCRIPSVCCLTMCSQWQLVCAIGQLLDEGKTSPCRNGKNIESKYFSRTSLQRTLLVRTEIIISSVIYFNIHSRPGFSLPIYNTRFNYRSLTFEKNGVHIKSYLNLNNTRFYFTYLIEIFFIPFKNL